MTEVPLTHKGIAASPGVALGFVHILTRGHRAVPRRTISAGEVDAELKRFEQALSVSRDQLHSLRRRISEEQGDDHVYLVEARLLMLDDPSLTEVVRENISAAHQNSEWAVFRAFEEFRKMFDKMEDEYFRDRRSEVEYVQERLLRNLIGEKDAEYVSVQRKTVLVSSDLSPEDLARISRDNLIALATDVGGRTSHTGILARALDIPCVMGLGEISVDAQNGDRIIVDGNEGCVLLRPDTATWSRYEERRRKYVTTRKELLKNRTFKAETRDHFEVRLLANIDLPEELPAVLANGAEGIGMLRTEHLFLGGSIPPSEEEQFQGYKKAVSRMKPHETVIRMLDLSGDEQFGPPGRERRWQNPALGLRGIRLLLKERSLLRTQLRALLRASAYGKVAVLYPMVTDVAEVREMNRAINDMMLELDAEKIRYDPDMRIGAMIEIPSAALTADLIAQEVDFFSIGTNDLVQYTLGVDRTNELVANLYQPMHRSVVALLKNIVRAGHKAGIEVGVCGEMAHDPLGIPILVALECNFFSMSVTSIPTVKHVIRDLSMEEAKAYLEEVCDPSGPSEVRKRFGERYSEFLENLSP